jgi:threonine synthase
MTAVPRPRRRRRRAPTCRPAAPVAAAAATRAPDGELPLRCPRRGPATTSTTSPADLDPIALTWPPADEPNPFVRYRTLWHGYHRARAAGWQRRRGRRRDRALDDAVARVEGHGFAVTASSAPTSSARSSASGRGGVLVKDETGNVSGSHKARHLFGTLLALRLAGADEPRGRWRSPAAATRRWPRRSWPGRRRELLVFVPTDADPACSSGSPSSAPRSRPASAAEGEAGDPTVLRMREALADGADPVHLPGQRERAGDRGRADPRLRDRDELRASGRPPRPPLRPGRRRRARLIGHPGAG